MEKITSKWNSLPKSVKSSIAFIFCSFFVKGVSFITTPIFTRLMSTEEYGIISIYNSWLIIIEVFALLGLTSAGVFNVGMNDNKDNRDKYISNCIGLCNLATLITFIILFVIKSVFKSVFLLSDSLLLIMFIHFLFNPAQIFWMTRQRYEYKYKLVTIVTIISILISQVLSIIAIVHNPSNGGYLKILCSEIGSLFFSIPIYILLIKKGKEYFNLKNWSKVLIFALPLLPHYLAQHVMTGCDRIMISEMVGKTATAIYNVVSGIGTIGVIFWSAINASLVPYTFEKLNNNKYKDIDKVAKMLLIMYALICFFIMVVAPEVLTFMAPEEYKEGVYLIPPITTVIFIQALYNLFANIEFYHKKSKIIATATVATTILNLILNYFCIKRYGYMAAAYTTLISYIVLVIFHYAGYRKCQKEKIYNIKFILLITLIVLAFAVISLLLYHLNNLIRYAIIIVLLILALFNINRIKELIKIFKGNINEN